MQSLEEIISQARDRAIEADATRVYVRALVSNDIDINRISNLEGSIQLGGNFQGNTLVYIGENAFSRRDYSNIIQSQREIIENIRQNKLAKINQCSNYTSQLLRENNCSNNDIQRISDLLYQAFEGNYCSDVSPKSVEGMIQHSNCYVSREINSNEVVSVLVSENADIQTPLGTLHFIEESEMATNSQHRRRGLSTQLVNLATQGAMNSSQIITAEARANHRSAMSSFYNNGFEFRGLLQNAVRINSDAAEVQQRNQYGTLALMVKEGDLNGN